MAGETIPLQSTAGQEVDPTTPKKPYNPPLTTKKIAYWLLTTALLGYAVWLVLGTYDHLHFTLVKLDHLNHLSAGTITFITCISLFAATCLLHVALEKYFDAHNHFYDNLRIRAENRNQTRSAKFERNLSIAYLLGLVASLGVAIWLATDYSHEIIKLLSPEIGHIEAVSTTVILDIYLILITASIIFTIGYQAFQLVDKCRFGFRKGSSSSTNGALSVLAPKDTDKRTTGIDLSTEPKGHAWSVDDSDSDDDVFGRVDEPLLGLQQTNQNP